MSSDKEELSKKTHDRKKNYWRVEGEKNKILARKEFLPKIFDMFKLSCITSLVLIISNASGFTKLDNSVLIALISYCVVYSGILSVSAFKCIFREEE